MTVVSNTTPLNYLILIGRVDVLSKLYELVIIPEPVFNELTAPSTPQLVRDWIANKLSCIGSVA
jgi:predicted nucleic acid-binding protein